MALVNNNVTNNGGVPGVSSGPLALRPAVGFSGQVYISNDAGNEGIYQWDSSTSAWILLTGGGGGGVGTLQQVTTLGNITNLQMFSIKDTIVTGDAIIGVRGLDDVDTRRAQLFSNDAEDAGILQLGHKDGTVAQVKFNNGGSDLNANLRSTGSDEDIAYLSDIPTLPTIVAGGFVPTLTLGSNATSATNINARFTRIGFTVNYYVSIDIDPTVAATFTNIQFTLPNVAAFASTDPIGAGSCFQSGAVPFVPVFCNQAGTTSTVNINFVPPALGTCRVYVQGIYQAA